MAISTLFFHLISQLLQPSYIYLRLWPKSILESGSIRTACEGAISRKNEILGLRSASIYDLRVPVRRSRQDSLIQNW